MSSPSIHPFGVEELCALEAANIADDEAFGAFYDRWCASVYGLALHILRHQEPAEAVTEEAFFRAWRNTRHLEDDGQLAGLWLLRLTQNLAVESLRRGPAQYPGHRLPSLTHATESTEPHPQTVSARPVHSSAIEMAFWDGLTYREIAAATGATVAQALNELRTGLRNLDRSVVLGARDLEGDAPAPSLD